MQVRHFTELGELRRVEDGGKVFGDLREGEQARMGVDQPEQFLDGTPVQFGARGEIQEVPLLRAAERGLKDHRGNRRRRWVRVRPMPIPPGLGRSCGA